MLNSFKVVNGLIVLLIVFCLLQLSTVAVFFPILSNDRENFVNQQEISNQRTELTGAWAYLLRTRLQANRAILSYLMEDSSTTEGRKEFNEQLEAAKQRFSDAKKYWATYESIPHHNELLFQELKNNYSILDSALTELIKFIDAGNTQAAYELQVQKSQVDFEKAYNLVIEDMNTFNQQVINHSQHSYNLAIWASVGVLVILLLVVIGAWSGIRFTLISPLNKIAASIRHISSGDLAQNIDVHGTNEMGQLAASLRSMQERLGQTVNEIRTRADVILTGASEISANNNDLSSRTEQQAAALEETAASMEEIKTTVSNNAENARQANTLSHQARTAANSGSIVMGDVVSTMDKISKSARKISEINRVIDGIANQTNILALNAAVEAARAGEQGRGFSVVATEVRNLAKRSADAAKEISLLINESVTNVDDGARLIEDAGKTMQEIVTSVTHVSNIMQEITQASEEQSTGVNQIAMAVNDMDLATQQNASMVEESSAITQNMNKNARQLVDTVSVFKVDLIEVSKDKNAQSVTRNNKNNNHKREIVKEERLSKQPHSVDDEWTEF